MAIWSQQFFTIIREGVLALTFALGFSVITSAQAQIIVRDDAGVYVGVHAGGRVVRQIGDQAIRIPLNAEGTGYDESILSFRYESNDCTGPELMQQATQLIEGGVVRGTTLHYAPQLASEVSCFSSSTSLVPSEEECSISCDGSCIGFIFIGPDTCCRQFTIDICVDLFGTVQTLDLSQFSLPFHVEVPEPTDSVCTLGQVGDACGVDSYCCSNKCRGPARGKSCK